MSLKKIVIATSCVLAICVGVLLFLVFKNNDVNNNDVNNNMSYTVIFNTDGGNFISSQVVKHNEKVLKPEEPKKEGYLFVDWLLNGRHFDFNTKITSNISLVANWKFVEPEIEYITVIFNTDGGNTFGNLMIEKGTTILKPEDPTKKGYTFVDWSLNGEKFDFNSVINEDIELIAKWKKNKETNNGSSINNSGNNTSTVNKYTVTFNSNGGSVVSNQTITEGGKASKPSNPIREGFNFEGWLLNGKKYNFDEKVNKDITLTANWLLLGDVNGDNNINTTDIVIITRYAHGTEIPTDYNIKAGDVNNDGVVDDVDAQILAKYIAGYVKKLPYNSGNKYTISYNLNGGTQTSYILKYAEVSLPYKLIKPTKEGYAFIGWTGSNGNVPELEVTIPSGTTGNLNYTANWLLLGDVNGDNNINTTDIVIITRYAHGTEIPIDYNIKAGDVNNDGVVDDVDAQILAKYIAGYVKKLPYNSGNKYTISYNLNGGTHTSYILKYAEVSLPYKLIKPTKEGYAFIGWTGSNGNVPELEVTIPSGTTGNLNYTANWLLSGDVNN